jgi:hypothetical protein
LKVLLLAGAWVLGGCVSLSSMQTARTVQKGTAMGSAGIGYEHTKFTSYSSDPDTKDLQRAIEVLPMPIIEGGIRYGVAENFDIGGKLSLLPGSLSASGKYMLMGRKSKTALATGLNLDYGSFKTSSSSSSTQEAQSTKVDYKLTIIDASVPFYTSYDINNVFSVFLTPRAGMRFTSSTSSEGDKSGSSPIVGLNVGFTIGWFVAEMALLDELNSKDSAILQQFTVGGQFGRSHLQQ